MGEQLRQLEQAATPGRWRAEPRHRYPNEDQVGGLGWEVIGPEEPQLRGQFGRRADAELIAVMRNALPVLLDIAEELRGVVEAGQLPEAETGIFADMLARLDGEDGQ